MKRYYAIKSGLALLACLLLLMGFGCSRVPAEEPTLPTETTGDTATDPTQPPTTLETEPPATDPPAPQLRERIAQLQAQNPDTVGYLRIEGTVIDHPVVQGPDNDYYLSHGFDGQSSRHGAVFWDAGMPGGELTPHIVIHGHNMLDGLMFGDLERFKDEDFWNTNPVIELETLYAQTRWEPIAVYLVDASEPYPLTFPDADYMLEYVQGVIDRALFSFEGTVTGDDIILTLNTCSYEWKGAHTLVCARLIEIVE